MIKVKQGTKINVESDASSNIIASEVTNSNSSIDVFKEQKLMLTEGLLTKNLAKPWMHISSKFDGGSIKFCSRGSWQTRCYGESLRLNLRPHGHH
ncbi:hypothetical protein KUTeg_004253 [Tegillarca granosa]|uniref:Uncharacterized protein n=1 Tax=Tegillarca granosa TaxID=220873 RepID=A0ABQ9FPE7_TEGGR|nr:hypothetical protein KUTeg_004253 [Tegillarca granosa]